MEFKDRVSAYPNRYILTTENGNVSYVILERADEPIVPGTPLNAETFNEMFGSITPSSIGAATANHSHSPSSVGAAAQYHEHLPGDVGLPKWISETGEENGLKYNVYSDGTAECWGEISVRAEGTHRDHDHCNLYNYLPVSFDHFDSVQVAVLSTNPSAPSDTQYVDYLSNLLMSVYNIDAEAELERLVVRFGIVEAGSYNMLIRDVDSVRLSVRVCGTVA